MLVGITGYAQHGKDTAANRLVDAWGFVRMGFADAVKEMALRCDPLIPHPEGNEYVGLKTYVKYVGWDEAKKNPEVRGFLQRLGTDAVRDVLGEDAWIQALERKWLESGEPDVVIPDVRFSNEGNWIHRQGGVIVKVYRPNFDNGVGKGHPSETGVDTIDQNYYVVNDGTIVDLAHKMDPIIRDLEEGFFRVPDVRTGLQA